jgi:hypothetical protein
MTDEQICQTVRSLFEADEKPEHLTPLDLLQTVRLLVEEQEYSMGVHVPQDELADQLCSSHDSIARSQARLHDAGWLVVKKATNKGRTNRLAVQVDKLPLAK